MRYITLLLDSILIIFWFPEGGSSLLCNPSPALQKLISKKDSTVIETNDISDDENHGELSLLKRPVMQFILQHHDLTTLKFAMTQALRWVFEKHDNNLELFLCKVFKIFC